MLVLHLTTLIMYDFGVASVNSGYEVINYEGEVTSSSISSVTKTLKWPLSQPPATVAIIIVSGLRRLSRALLK